MIRFIYALGDTRWPENSFMIRYQKKSQAFFVFVKNILLEPLLASSLTWPEAIKPILAAKPHGHFHDTQLQFKPSGIESILTRFTDLGWQGLNTGLVSIISLAHSIGNPRKGVWNWLAKKFN